MQGIIGTSKVYRWLFLSALLLVGLNVCALSANAPSTLPARAMTPADLGTFFDGIVPARLKRADIGGAAVLVVKDGQVLFFRAYGDANIAERRPITVDNTLFRMGSISSLLTWVAVMQQVEQGKIDLDADINTYLDIQVPPAFGKPITMRNLMTHTTGFESTIQGYFAADAGHLGSLRDFVLTHFPARIYPPGSLAVNTSFDATLAGYIVQRVSGVAYAAYISRHILSPLAMAHATYAQPLPPALAPLMAAGYQRTAQGAQPFEWIAPLPDGGLTASLGDMAHFMIACLEGGAYQQGRVLQPATLAHMLTPQTRFDPRENAMGLGFPLMEQNGQRATRKGANNSYSYQSFNLLPDAHVGLFVAYNSEGGNIDIFHPLFDPFMDRYFPYVPPARPTLAGAAADAATLAGPYMKAERGRKNLAYLAAILGESELSVGKDGTLVRNGREAFRETAPGYWENTRIAQDHMIFKTGDDGRTQFSYGNPYDMGIRAEGVETQPLIEAVLLSSLGFCLLSLLSWPVLALLRRRAPPEQMTPAARLARIGVRLTALLHLLFWLAFLAAFTVGSSDMQVLAAAWFDPLLRTIQIVCWLAALSLVNLLWATALAWRGAASWRSKVHLSALLLACLASTWLAWYLNVLAFHVRY